MEISKCMGCMGEYHGYPCPNCGYDPGQQKGLEYALPTETIVGGKYLTGRVLGQGGFGITYIGWDIALERKVAVKEYYPSGQVSRAPGTRNLTWYTGDSARSARQDGMEMFLKEARKMAKLEDIPGVVKIRDLFQENETAYIVMDFVEGKTLKAILKETGPMGWEQARGIFSQAIRSMELVHEAGLIHRDLSPDNLMITPNGSVRILDLGAAKDLKLNSGASSMQVAKHGFSPYEQYTQRGGSGPWTDVYAMAATIYYTLTGKMPPPAMDRMEEDTLRWDHPNLRSVPAPALDALKKAMAIMAKQRTQTMTELGKGLFTAAPNPEPRPAPAPKPTPRPTPTPSAPKELPRWVVPAAAALVVAAAVAFIVTGKDAKGSSQPQKAQTTAVTKQTEPKPQPPEETASPSDSRQIHFMAEVEEIPYTVAFDETGKQPFWGQTKYTRDQVEKVVFRDTQEGAPGSAWSVSNEYDDGVLAWMDGSTLYVAANGRISPNENGGYLFEYFRNLQTIDFGDCFDTSHVSNMCDMFACCYNLTGLDVSGFDTSNVTSMHCMFNGCLSLTELDVSGFDTSRVTDMSYMFSGCSSLTSLDVSEFDTANVTNMEDMFSYCNRLARIDLSGLDTANVTDMNNMFACCFDLTSLDLSGFDTSNVQDMSLMFAHSNLQKLDLSNFDTSSVTTMKYMFEDCAELTSLNLSGFHVGSDTKLEDMFTGCTSLTNLQCSDSAIQKAYRNR